MDDEDEMREKVRNMTELSQVALPKLWHGLYANMVAEGFTREDALALLKVYILGGQINGAKCI